MLYDLQESLKEITGMHEVSLQSAAGAQGEWTALMMIRAFHEANGDHHRTKVIVPDSAMEQIRHPQQWLDLKL